MWLKCKIILTFYSTHFSSHSPSFMWAAISCSIVVPLANKAHNYDKDDQKGSSHGQNDLITLVPTFLHVYEHSIQKPLLANKKGKLTQN